LALAKFVKVDFHISDGDSRRALAQRFRSRGIRLIAEKLETQIELNEARSLGYTFFQGYFFCKPSMVSTRDIPGNKLNYLRLLQAVPPPNSLRMTSRTSSNRTLPLSTSFSAISILRCSACAPKSTASATP
jgi:c-di-GMP-related signal transduction protein